MTSNKSIRKSQFRTASRLLELEKSAWELSKGCSWRRKLNRISASCLSFLNVVVLRTRPGWVENLALYLCEHNPSQPVAKCLSIALLCSPRTPCITRWGRIFEQVSGLTYNRNSSGCESRDRERERESRARITEILSTIDTLSYLLSWFCFPSGASCIHRSLSVRSTVEAGLTASASEAAEMAPKQR